MAVLTHIVGGIDYIASPGSITTGLLEDATYVELVQTGSVTAGSVLDTDYSVQVTGDIVDTNIPAVYTVNYVLTEAAGDTAVSTIVQTVTVTAKSTSENFTGGTALRDGTDVDGTTYHSEVQEAIAGNGVKDSSAAYFEELALDPYEVKHAK